MSRDLPPCPCGSPTTGVTWSRGQTVPDAPLQPDRVTFQPCGHSVEAPSQWYLAAVLALVEVRHGE